MNTLRILLAGLLVAAVSSSTPLSAVSDNPQKKAGPPPHETELQMLDAARSQVAHATAALQAQVCLQVAQGYAQLDRSRGVAELKQCFQHTLRIDEQEKSLKTSLQFKIMDSLYLAEPVATLELLPGAEAPVRTNIQTRALEKMVSKKQFDEALSLITELSYSAEFPYEAAAALMLQLPSGREQDQRFVFAAALSSYRLEDPATDPHFEDMATLVVRFWRQLPPPLVMQAIDEVLDHARKDLKNENAPMLTIGTSLGEAQFSSGYQFRLFELLPVIQALDSSRAESMLHENPNLAAVLKSYPQGLQSLEPTYRDTPLKEGESPAFSMTHRLAGATREPDPTDLFREKANREAQGIVGGWQDDPRAAIKKAVQLPDIGLETTGRSPRANALAGIAAAAFQKRPDISESALTELIKIVSDYPPLPQSAYLLIAAGVHFRMKQPAAANELIARAFSTAAKLYERDINPDDPNKAFKFDWPSAAVWRACVILQDKVEPGISPKLLQQIKDPEIRASAQITLANTRLGVPVPANTVRQQFGKGTGTAQDFPMPH